MVSDISRNNIFGGPYMRGDNQPNISLTINSPIILRNDELSKILDEYKSVNEKINNISINLSKLIGWIVEQSKKMKYIE